jgi:hypothetical protein
LPTGAIFRCYPGYVDNCFFQFIYDPDKYSSEKVQKSKKFKKPLPTGAIFRCRPDATDIEVRHRE